MSACVKRPFSVTCNAMGPVIHSFVAWVLRAARKGFSVFKRCLNPPQPSHARYFAQVLPAHSRIHLLAMQNKARHAIHHLDSFTCLHMVTGVWCLCVHLSHLRCILCLHFRGPLKWRTAILPASPAHWHQCKMGPMCSQTEVWLFYFLCKLCCKISVHKAHTIALFSYLSKPVRHFTLLSCILI